MSVDNSNNIFNDVTESFKSIVLERFSSPLLFSFSISWSIINYRVFLVAFSGADITEKLKILDDYFKALDNYIDIDLLAIYTQSTDFVFDPIIWLTSQSNLLHFQITWYTDTCNFIINYIAQHLHTIFLPALIAFFYVFVYPIINRKVLAYTIGRKKLERSDRLNDEKSILYTYDDVLEIYNSTEREIQRYKDENSRLKAQNLSLQPNNEDVSNRSNVSDSKSDVVTQPFKVGKTELKRDRTLSATIKAKKSDTADLTDEELKIIKYIGDTTNSGARLEREFLRALKISPVLLNYSLSNLIEKSYVKSFTKIGVEYLDLTTIGMRTYIDKYGRI